MQVAGGKDGRDQVYKGRKVALGNRKRKPPRNVCHMEDMETAIGYGVIEQGEEGCDVGRCDSYIAMVAETDDCTPQSLEVNAIEETLEGEYVSGNGQLLKALNGNRLANSSPRAGDFKNVKTSKGRHRS